MLTEALHHLQSAIELLDRAEAPGQIAAGVDLAAHQLGRLLTGSSPNAKQLDVGGEGFETN